MRVTEHFEVYFFIRVAAGIPLDNLNDLRFSVAIRRADALQTYRLQTLKR